MSKKVSKWISILVLSLFIVQCFNLNNYTVVKAETEYEAFLQKVKDHGLPPGSINGYSPNLNTYKIYKKIVYGSPSNVPGNELKNGQYRYLGFDEQGINVTNEVFRDDARGSTSYEDWAYIDISAPSGNSAAQARQSWTNLNNSLPLLYNYNWNAKWKRNGETTSMSATRIGSTSKVMLLTPATLFSEGAVLINHKVGSSVWYSTFSIPPLLNNENLKGNIKTDKELYIIKSNENDLTINLGSYADLVFSNSYFTKEFVNGLTARIMEYKIDNGQKQSLDIDRYGGSIGNAFNVSKENSFTLSRGNFTEGKQHYITFYGYMAFASVPDAGGITLRINIEKKVPIYIEPAAHKPTAKIIADDTVYVGDEVEIIGIGEDERDNPDTLSYRWGYPDKNWNTKEGKNDLNNSFPNVGGTVIFEKEGDYTFNLTVENRDGYAAAATKTIKAMPKGKILINLNVDNDPKQVELLEEQNIYQVKINAEGILTGLEGSGKTVKKLELIGVQAPNSHIEGSEMDLTNKQEYSIIGNEKTIKKEFIFDIETLGEEYTQYFRVIFNVEYTDGTKDSIEKDLKTVFYKNIMEKPIEPPSNNPPQAFIYAKDTVIMGDDIVVTGTGYDKEDDIKDLTYKWSHGGNLEGDLKGPGSLKVWFKYDRREHIGLTVTDTKGASGNVDKYIEVLPAKPHFVLDIEGQRKINRKLDIKANYLNGCSLRYPVDWDDVTWDIYPYDSSTSLSDIKTLLPNTIITNGEGIKVMQIKGNYEDIELLFKKVGMYAVKATLHSTAGTDAAYSNTVTNIITIDPDLPPIADFEIIKRTIRDPNYNNIATINVTDTSSSIDADKIVKRIWFYCFDSNNDDSYDNEIWYVLDDYTWRPVTNYGIDGSYASLKTMNYNLINDKNKTEVAIRSDKVGNYFFELVVVEDTLNNTIPEFINATDILKGNTFN